MSNHHAIPLAPPPSGPSTRIHIDMRNAPSPPPPNPAYLQASMTVAARL